MLTQNREDVRTRTGEDEGDLSEVVDVSPDGTRLFAVLSNGRLTSIIGSNGAQELRYDGRRIAGDAGGGSAHAAHRLTLRIDGDDREVDILSAGDAETPLRLLFDAGRVAFERSFGELHAVLDAYVSTKHDAEMRRFTLRNDGAEPRSVEIRSSVHQSDDSGIELVHELIGTNSGREVDVDQEPRSVRFRVRLEPGDEGEFILVTCPGNGDVCRPLSDAYSRGALDVASDMRAAGAREVERLLMLNLTPIQARYLRRLAAALFCEVEHARAPREIVDRVSLPDERLEEFNLGPVRPLAVVRLSDEDSLKLLLPVLKAHRYWAALRLDVDIVLLNDRSETESAEELQVQIERMLEDFDAPEDSAGGVQSHYADDLPTEIQILMQARACLLVRDHLPKFE